MTEQERNKLMRDRLAQKKNVKEQFLGKITGMPAHLRPTNVGDINKLIWPAFFTSTPIEIAPNTLVQSSFVVDAEAALIITALAKMVALRSGAGPYDYTVIDTQNENAGGNIDDLFFQIRDAQSGRVFSSRTIAIEALGDGQEPTMLETPWMVLPNSTVEVIFDNQSANTYVAAISAFGSRLRIPDANSILGTTTGPQGLAKGL